MTKFEALIACRNHWQWLAITKADSKNNYEPSISWFHECACCEYVRPFPDIYYPCRKCPLNGYAWGTEDKFGRSYYLCERAYWSYFEDWKRCRGIGDINLLQKAALQMVQACNRAIEDLIIYGDINE